MTPAVSSEFLPDPGTIPIRIGQTIFGAALLLRVAVQSLTYLAAGGDDPDVDYRLRTAPSVTADGGPLRLVLQSVSFGVGCLLMAYALAAGVLEAPWLRFAQAFWVTQAGALITLPVADRIRWLGRDRS
jgi:hypothetical protein